MLYVRDGLYPNIETHKYAVKLIRGGGARALSWIELFETDGHTRSQQEKKQTDFSGRGADWFPDLRDRAEG